MTESDYPDWVLRDPKKYIERLKHEANELYRKFPYFGVYLDGGTLYLEGPVVTLSNNQYTVRVVYPSEYPSKKPEGFVLDPDVRHFCNIPGNSGHTFHNYGANSPHGVHLCLMGYDDSVNKGWTPNQSGITILEYAIMWLHAYEFKRSRGYWPLPER